MVLVDSSIWIDYFCSAETPQVAPLDSLFGHVSLLVDDLITAEVLQGNRDDQQCRRVKRVFASFHHIDIVDYDLGGKAAHKKSRRG